MRFVPKGAGSSAGTAQKRPGRRLVSRALRLAQSFVRISGRGTRTAQPRREKPPGPLYNNTSARVASSFVIADIRPPAGCQELLATYALRNPRPLLRTGPMVIPLSIAQWLIIAWFAVSVFAAAVWNISFDIWLRRRNVPRADGGLSVS